jgi:hypothetical protein
LRRRRRRGTPAHLVHKLAGELRALAWREQHGSDDWQVYRHKCAETERAGYVVACG